MSSQFRVVVRCGTKTVCDFVHAGVSPTGAAHEALRLIWSRNQDTDPKQITSVVVTPVRVHTVKGKQK